MAQNVYECLFILDANRYARDPNKVAGAIPGMIEKLEGEVLANRLWNEQRLAYPINGQRKGTYWLTYFRLESARLAEFSRACRLNDNILRNLTLKVDPRLVDTLVAHAKGETTPGSDDTPEETAASDNGSAASKDTASKDTASKDTASKDTASKDTASKETASKETASEKTAEVAVES